MKVDVGLGLEVNSTHRIVVMAIERGRLHDLVFDNQAHLSHRAMAAILGVILRLAPAEAGARQPPAPLALSGAPVT